MKKILILSAMLLTTLFANAQAMRSGAKFSFYQLENNANYWEAEQEAVSVIVDNKDKFIPESSMRGNNATKDIALSGYIAFNWEGFIEIKEAGAYVFSLGADVTQATTYLFVNSQKILTCDKLRNVSKALLLEPGFYKIDLARSLNANYKHIETKVSYYNKKNPTKIINITPASLVHR